VLSDLSASWSHNGKNYTIFWLFIGEICSFLSYFMKQMLYETLKKSCHIRNVSSLKFYGWHVIPYTYSPTHRTTVISLLLWPYLWLLEWHQVMFFKSHFNRGKITKTWFKLSSLENPLRRLKANTTHIFHVFAKGKVIKGTSK